VRLLDKRCQPCEGGTPPLGPEEADFLLSDQVPAWQRDGDWIQRDLVFKDFKTAVAFVRDVADIAEDEGHHPDILIHRYKHVRLRLQTHAAGGLTENDFILAAKLERLHGQRYA